MKAHYRTITYNTNTAVVNGMRGFLDVRDYTGAKGLLEDLVKRQPSTALKEELAFAFAVAAKDLLREAGRFKSASLPRAIADLDSLYDAACICKPLLGTHTGEKQGYLTGFIEGAARLLHQLSPGKTQMLHSSLRHHADLEQAMLYAFRTMVRDASLAIAEPRTNIHLRTVALAAKSIARPWQLNPFRQGIIDSAVQAATDDDVKRLAYITRSLDGVDGLRDLHDALRGLGADVSLGIIGGRKKATAHFLTITSAIKGYTPLP